MVWESVFTWRYFHRLSQKGYRAREWSRASNMNEEEAPIHRSFSITFTELSVERGGEIARPPLGFAFHRIETSFTSRVVTEYIPVNRAARHLCGTRKIEWTEVMRVTSILCFFVERATVINYRSNFNPRPELDQISNFEITLVLEKIDLIVCTRRYDEHKAKYSLETSIIYRE